VDDKKFGIIAGHSAASSPKSLPGLLDLPAGGAAIEERRGSISYIGGGCIRRDSKGVSIIYINIRVGQLDLIYLSTFKILGNQHLSSVTVDPDGGRS
jgi:hypothetical protein